MHLAVFLGNPAERSVPQAKIRAIEGTGGGPVSIGFYVRCMMFEQAQSYGVQPEKPSVFLPVDSLTAAAVLLGAALVFIVLGMVVFSRSEYQDIA